jgi:bifunctional UDP-N-acetylglucosamine pyrophosphorylase/glucosamine-1-phosphate N-acetyltransferase
VTDSTPSSIDTSTRPLYAVVLAAGEGSRMKSERPKPLHRLCGKPMLAYVLESLATCHAERAAIVVGHKGDWVTKKIAEENVGVRLEFVEQAVQRGTGDAALIGLSGLPDDFDDDSDVVVLPGDTPLLTSTTIGKFVAQHRDSDVAATVLTAVVDDPTGYGRVVRGKHGRVVSIVEHGDATPDQLDIDEINTSIYCFKRSLLAPALRRLNPDNAQGEYYLTDVVAVLAEAGHAVDTFIAPSPAEASGVNDRLQLALAEAEMRRRTNEALLRSGVTMLDPASTFDDTTVVIGRDVTLFPGVLLQGATVVGDGTEIGPNCRLVDCKVGSNAVIEETSARRAVIGDEAHVGPYAHLAPGSDVPAGAVTGPFYNSTARPT